MFTKFHGLKATGLSLASAVVMFGLLIHFQVWWQTKTPLFGQLIYPLLLITALFAAQFNRSRITLLCMVCGLFAATSAKILPWSPWLAANNNWVILTGSSILLLLAFIKDRGLLSIHGITRLISIALCGGLAYGWLMLNELTRSKLIGVGFSAQLLAYLPLVLPLGITVLLLLWRSLTQNSLTVSALLVSFVAWWLQHQHLIDLPWPVLISVLSIHYLISVISDSYFLAYRDDLTSLPSRRALNQLAMSLGRKYTVAMLDIDHFKKFNDTYGHDIGDQVLKLVAVKISKIKGGGRVFRYGGEEFTIVFPRKTIEQALPHLDQLRQAIADHNIVVRQPVRKNKDARKAQKQPDQKTVSVTISIGVAQRGNKQSFEQTLKEADLALYRAKHKGRNNVSQ